MQEAEGGNLPAWFVFCLPQRKESEISLDFIDLFMLRHLVSSGAAFFFCCNAPQQVAADATFAPSVGARETKKGGRDGSAAALGLWKVFGIKEEHALQLPQLRWVSAVLLSSSCPSIDPVPSQHVIGWKSGLPTTALTSPRLLPAPPPPLKVF